MASNLHLPDVSFDWLANLPNVVEETRKQGVLNTGLRGLDLTSADALDKAADRFYKQGLFDQAIKLTTAAQNRREQEARAGFANSDLIGAILGGGAPSQAEPKPITKPPFVFNDPDEPQPQPTVVPPAATSGGPSWLGPAQVARPPGVAPAPAVGPPTLRQSGLPPSPSEQMLAQAEGGPGPMAPRGPQLAGPATSTIPISPPASGAFGANPLAPGGPGVSTGQLPAGPQVAPPVAARPAPAQAPAQAPVEVPGINEPTMAPEEARAEVLRLGALIPQLYARKVRPEVMQAVMAKYRNALSQSNMTKEQQEYLTAMRQRPPEERVRIDEYEAQKKVAPEELKAARDRYKVYNETGDKARNVLTTIGQMQTLLKDPNFTSGEGTEVWRRAGSLAAGLISTAESLGVDEKVIKPLKDAVLTRKAIRGAEVGNMFTALANDSVFKTLGTLGNQISEGDRNFISAAFPSLQLTPGGNAMLLEHMAAIAKRNLKIQDLVQQYKTHYGFRTTEEGLDTAVKKYADSHPIFAHNDGKLTAAGEKLQSQVEALGVTTQPPPQTRTPAAIPSIPPGAPAGSIIIEKSDSPGEFVIYSPSQKKIYPLGTQFQ